MNMGREPESSEAALMIYGRMIMPERDLSRTIERLRPMLNDPELQKKIEEAASKNTAPQEKVTVMDEAPSITGPESMKPAVKASERKDQGKVQMAVGSDTMLAQVVGVILGSPEFQRK
jgi:hypothetical protein